MQPWSWLLANPHEYGEVPSAAPAHSAQAAALLGESLKEAAQNPWLPMCRWILRGRASLLTAAFLGFKGYLSFLPPPPLSVTPSLYAGIIFPSEMEERTWIRGSTSLWDLYSPFL